MLNRIKQVLYFLCLIDGNQINIPDIAFLIILGKIILATNVDWPSLATLAIAVLNSCHSRQTVATQDISNMTTQIQNLETTVTQVKAAL
jgi:hypothetical protein